MILAALVAFATAAAFADQPIVKNANPVTTTTEVASAITEKATAKTTEEAIVASVVQTSDGTYDVTVNGEKKTVTIARNANNTSYVVAILSPDGTKTNYVVSAGSNDVTQAKNAIPMQATAPPQNITAKTDGTYATIPASEKTN
ncbi:hypothetical protein HY933_01450 [Candidatus Falkowbacteria bacterium]|nr:hypothetical protein [Candidatus Falkowbacteria bacterium]